MMQRIPQLGNRRSITPQVIGEALRLLEKASVQSSHPSSSPMEQLSSPGQHLPENLPAGIGILQPPRKLNLLQYTRS
jgi:hypothetical protein